LLGHTFIAILLINDVSIALTVVPSTAQYWRQLVSDDRRAIMPNWQNH
jgi:hypothetical protein